jgi:hypothetical protein
MKHSVKACLGFRRPGTVAGLLLFLLLMFLPGKGTCESQEVVYSLRVATAAAAMTQPRSSPGPTAIPITYVALESGKPVRSLKADMWRTLVTGAGSFPFTYFYTNFIFDTVRFASNGFDTQYAPWPLKTQYSAEVSTAETFLRLGVSLGLSAIVGVLDTLIQRK